MEAERKRSKGSFFNLLDWNGKSRKKLYASNSGSLEGSVEGKERGESRTKSRYVVMDGRAFNPDTNDYTCDSSVPSDEACYASRPPGAVARLMGLDSLPTSSNHEPTATLFLKSQSLKASPYDTVVPHLWSENNPMIFQDVNSKHDGCSWECMKPRPHKLQSRPIERFQTEMLPPKSGKTIPITHHKLSPIRNPGLMTRENAAYVMEAAAKIMEASPRASNSKMPSITSPIPVRIRDLKQKMEAAHAASVVQRNSSLGSGQGRQHQSLNGFEGMHSNSVLAPSRKGTSDGARRKGVAASTITRPNASEQRREKSPSGNIGNMKEKERDEVKSNVTSRRPPASEKSVTKRASGRNTGNVLNQNNQKQNATFSKDGLISKPSVCDQQVRRKVQTTNLSGVPSRTMNETAYRTEMGSRKIVAGSAKEKLNSISQKKRSGDTCLAVDTNSSGIVSFNKGGRAIKCTVTMDGFNNKPHQHNMKNATDVVSFTFSSPIKTKPSSQSSGSLQLFDGQDKCFKNLASLPMENVVGADALCYLLEQKLKELTERVQSSNYNVIREKTSANARDSTSALSLDISRTRSMGNRRLFQSSQDASTSNQLGESECFLPTNSSSSVPQKWEQTESEEMEEHSSSSDYIEAGKECLGPSPISILQPLYKSGNCSKAQQSFKLLSAAQEAHDTLSDGECLHLDETKASDSVSLISVADVGTSPLAEPCASAEEDSGDTEMNHLKCMLRNAHLILEEFASGRTSKVMEYHLFDWLENRDKKPIKNAAEYSKLEHKLLFDCAIEWLDAACARVSLGGCKAWSRLWTLFQREGWAAEKLYEEILSWRSMEDMMVDEIVDRDMSYQYGKWIDFEQEAFEEGVGIERHVLTSLVDELVSDLLPL